MYIMTDLSKVIVIIVIGLPFLGVEEKEGILLLLL
jgi:hypothetical protein